MAQKKRLFIISAGRFGREALAWALDVPEAKRDWELAGFLDGRTNVLDGYDTPIKIVGDPSSYKPERDDVFVCAIGDSKARLELCRSLEQRGFTFARIVHPTAVIGPRVSIGEGAIICPYVIITTDIRIGRHCLLNLHATVGHDASLGDGCTLSDHADVCGGVTLEEGVFLSSHASCVPDITVGAYSVLGAGAVAVKDIPANVLALGVPAKPRS